MKSTNKIKWLTVFCSFIILQLSMTFVKRFNSLQIDWRLAAAGAPLAQTMKVGCGAPAPTCPKQRPQNRSFPTKPTGCPAAAATSPTAAAFIPTPLVTPAITAETPFGIYKKYFHLKVSKFHKQFFLKLHCPKSNLNA